MVRFPDGKKSRVLKVSYGTNHVFIAEPMWKRALCKMLPEGLQKTVGPMKRYAQITEHDSLAIFMDPLDHSMGVFATFPDGTVSGSFWNRGSQGPIIFTSYPREEKEVRLRFDDKNYGLVEINIPNPHRVVKASWSNSRLRQTNQVFGSEVVFEPSMFWDGYHPGGGFRARSPKDGPTGWMQWRTTLFDPSGNWYRGDYGRTPRVPGPKSNKQFKVLAEGEEYISAGLVGAPADREYLALPLNQRATNWGVRFVGLFGPGLFQVSEAFGIQSMKTTGTLTNAIKRSGASWLVQCAEPTLCSISTRPVFGLRFRERLLHNRGRVFAGRRMSALTNQELVAQPFASRLPITTTNLEAEVVVRWPPVEFFVEKPMNP